jgi:hypothetical protein
LLIAAVSPVEAAQPLATDDAAVLPPRSCQLEAWARSSHDGPEYGAQPACNVTGAVELAIGGTRMHPDAGHRSSVLQAQAKTVLFPRADGAWSFGVVAGATRDTGAPHGNSAFQTYFAKGLASWYPHDDLELDLNLGAADSRESGTLALAGASVQYAVAPDLQLLAETFRDEPGRGKYQVGVRYLAIKDRFEAFIGYGNRLGGSLDARWVIVGVRMQTPPLPH